MTAAPSNTATPKPRGPINLALQGGGSHGAFTWGVLDALLKSYTRGGEPVPTPYLKIEYQPTWRWEQPAPPPPGRPWSEQ